MSNESASIEIYLTSQYRQNLRDLAKKYRNIRLDIEPIIAEIQAGNFLGNSITGLRGNYLIYKARIKNSNLQKGKSAGYRLIYQVESPTVIILLTIYSKSQREDISIKEIRNILDDFYSE